MSPTADAGVVVIGGGIAGTSVAYELAQRTDVTLIERESQLGQHTTGRSAAMYIPTYGNAVVRALTAASREGYRRIEADLDTPPLLTARMLLRVATHEDRAQLDQLVTDRGPNGPAPIERREAMALCPVLRPEMLGGAAVEKGVSDIDVASLHQAFARGLGVRGGRVIRGEPVVALEPAAQGWVVSTPARRVHADYVVNAAGSWADEVAALAGVRPAGLTPLRRTLFTCPAPEGTDTAGWPSVLDAAERFYFKPEPSQVLVSPADETPSPPCDARPDEVDIAWAIELVNQMTTLGLRHVRSSWAGLRTFAPDRTPVVGTRPGEDGFFWFAGQGGFGIQTSPALARTGAALLADGALPADVAVLGVTADHLAPSRLDPMLEMPQV